MAFGITPTGFNLKRLEDIKSEIEEDLRQALGQGINILPESVLGQIIGVMADRESSIWEDLQAVYFSQYPATAQGVNLDNVADITGSIRKKATKSQIIAQLLFGTPGTIITIGSTVAVFENDSAVFVVLANVTLVAGTDEIQSLAFSATPTSGVFTINIGTIAVIGSFDDTAATLQAKIDAALVSAGKDAGTVTAVGDVATGGPVTLTSSGDDENGFGKRDVALVTITANSLDDGGPVTVTPTETTAGVPQGEVNMEGQTTGPTDAPSGTLNVIKSPISGWDATVNPLDAVVGREQETDPDFRLSRKSEVAKSGAATPDAIFADINTVEGVTAVIVFINNTDVTDVDGRPPHSVDIVVQDGDDDEIATAIFGTVGGGPGFIGDISKIVLGADGFPNTVKFSRPLEVDIHVEMDLTTDAALYPVDGDAQVEAAILVYGLSLKIGQEVVVHGSDPSLECAVEGIPGIVDIEIRVGKAASPTTDDNVVIERREIAKFDSSRITIVSV